MSHFNQFYALVKAWAATDDRLHHTEESPSVMLCNSFNSRIQLLQEADPEREALIMIDLNRSKYDTPANRGNYYTMYFCWREHEFTDLNKLNDALDNAEELMDDFTSYLVAEYKKAKKSGDLNHPLRFLEEGQQFPAETTAPFDGGWVCYEMTLQIGSPVCRKPTSTHKILVESDSD